MYLMVVVVAAVDAVDNVSFAQSDRIQPCVSLCRKENLHGEDLGINCRLTRCSLSIPRRRDRLISVFHNVVPLVC
jgi:hypothetical protein